VADGANDASVGALRLVDPALASPAQLRQVKPLAGSFSGCRLGWRSALETAA
jgi:hypothetical protein